MSRMTNVVHLAGEIVIGRGRQMEENLNCKFLHTEIPDLPSEGFAPPPTPSRCRDRVYSFNFVPLHLFGICLKLHNFLT